MDNMHQWFDHFRLLNDNKGLSGQRACLGVTGGSAVVWAFLCGRQGKGYVNVQGLAQAQGWRGACDWQRA